MKNKPTKKPITYQDKAKMFSREELARLIIISENKNVRMRTFMMLMYKLKYRMTQIIGNSTSELKIKIVKMRKG